MCTSVNTNVVSHRCLKRLHGGLGLFVEGLRGRERTEEQFLHLCLLAGLSCGSESVMGAGGIGRRNLVSYLRAISLFHVTHCDDTACAGWCGASTKESVKLTRPREITVEMNKRSRKFLHAGDLTDQGRTTECGHCTATIARQRDARDDWVPRAAQRPPRP